MTVLMDGVVFGESPRWHEGRWWFSDWGAHEVVALDADGRHEVVARVESFPMCIDFLPDGRLLVVDSDHQRLLRREPDGRLVTHADLSSSAAGTPWNDIVVDVHGGCYVNNIGFDFPAGTPAPGLVVHVAPDGQVRRVADDLAFPNGMAITADAGTLVVAESHASRLTAFDVGSGGDLRRRRVWAETPEDHPDGICLDAEGALWYADVGNRRCVRVREGGEVLARVPLDRGAFGCALSRGERPQLAVTAQEHVAPGSGAPSGQVVVVPAPAPGAGRP